MFIFYHVFIVCELSPSIRCFVSNRKINLLTKLTSPVSCQIKADCRAHFQHNLYDDLLIFFFFLSIKLSVSIENEEFEIVPLTPEKVLELIEQAYPNPITPDDLAR